MKVREHRNKKPKSLSICSFRLLHFSLLLHSEVLQIIQKQGQTYFSISSKLMNPFHLILMSQSYYFCFKNCLIFIVYKALYTSYRIRLLPHIGHSIMDCPLFSLIIDWNNIHLKWCCVKVCQLKKISRFSPILAKNF